MSEPDKDMGKVLQFRPRETKPQPSPTSTRPNLNEILSTIQGRDVYPGVTIPSLDALYHDDQLSIQGVSVAEMLTTLSAVSDKAQADQKIEELQEKIFDARLAFLGETVTGRGRELAYRDLVAHTFGVASEIRSEDLRLRLRGKAILLARDVLGDHAAGKFIERLDLIGFANTNTGNKTPDTAPDSSGKVVPFRSKNP